MSSEAFVIYYGGNALQLHWNGMPPITRMPAVRLCAIRPTDMPSEPTWLVLLTADNSLYSACLLPNNMILELQLLRIDVVDVDFCRSTQELFVVTIDGVVQRQRLIDTKLRQQGWQTLSFDPLELCTEGVCIRRVCCSTKAVVFVSASGETYVLGSCGEVFSTESEPRHMRLYEEGRELLDMVAGNEHFVMLLAPLSSADSIFNLQPTNEDKNLLSNFLDPLNGSQKYTLDYTSAKSSSSTTDSTHTESSFVTNARHILQQGHALLHTEVYTFGATNNGLLGTGDHIKRAGVVRVQKLEGMGVCSIAAGREHTVARTLDGRLYHWGINSQSQLNSNADDLSAPTEITLGEQVPLPKEEHIALEACCGDYRTLLLNAAGQIHTLPLKQQSTYSQTLLHLQLGAAWPKQLKLLHSVGGYTLQNCRHFQTQYHYYLSHLQSQLQLLLKHRVVVNTLQIRLRQSAVMALKILEPLLLNWERMICLLGATLHSLEGYYRGDYEQPADLLFVCYYREYIELFDGYTKSYCDIFSINGFGEAIKAMAALANPLAELNEESYVARLFQQPFQIFPVFIQFIELLIKTQPEYNEHRVAWTEFARNNCISQELAVNTKEFWINNERDLRIRKFRRRHRRVILTSSMVPLKLDNLSIMTSTSFILFSDCLCQVGGKTVYTYPLTTVWVLAEGEMGLRITTPEKNFTLMTRSHENRKVWLDQLQTSIVAALGRPLGSLVPNIRSATYTYSRDHARYANVKAWGMWRKGVLHGNCCLKYPDGSIYCGEVQNGVVEGYGKMEMPSTWLYIGNFKGDRFHGHGVYEERGIEVYEGHFCKGLFHGHGMMRNNRYIYVGEYQANTRSGYGVLEDLVSGDKYMGMFADNKRTGAGLCITSRGDYFEGIFTGDELVGSGLAILENDYYYEGELNLNGPNGKGVYYMPGESIVKTDDLVPSNESDDDDCNNFELIGNKISGQLGGSWQNVRIQVGELTMNRRFPKFPKSIGQFAVDNNRKWRTLFQNFESEIWDCSAANISKGSSPGSIKKRAEATQTTEQLWSCLSVYINRKRAIDLSSTQTCKYFNHNILLDFGSGSFELLSQKPIQPKHAHTLDLLNIPLRRIHSQEALCSKESLQRADSLISVGQSTTHSGCDLDASSFASFQDLSLHDSFGVDPDVSSQCTLNGSGINIPNNNNTSQHNNNSNISCSSTTIASTSRTHELVPSFGMGALLTEQDVTAIRVYLEQAFKDRYHPLYILNERIAQCFHYSYGYWKVKPTPILAKQAMREWESISRRMYTFVRKMFPALPEDYCQIEGTREVISHITILYPIMLSEGIYSTLFVLYANKYSHKDEMYRQNVNFAEKFTNDDLVELIRVEQTLSAVMLDGHFDEAVQTLKQLQEKFSPKDMLMVIQNCMELLTEAYKRSTANAEKTQLNADSMMPLTLLAVLRAAVPHLGAELALLEDLTGGANFQAEMNGLAGYCYTTLKAAYEHVISKALQQTT